MGYFVWKLKVRGHFEMKEGFCFNELPPTGYKETSVELTTVYAL
jgi:hypothetical protein